MTHAAFRTTLKELPLLTNLEVASRIVSAEIAGRRGRWDDAVRTLQEATAIEDAIPYNEPPVWHQPVRQVLAAVLLEAGRPQEAERVYREDLKRFRETAGRCSASCRASRRRAVQAKRLTRGAGSNGRGNVQTSRSRRLASWLRRRRLTARREGGETVRAEASTVAVLAVAATLTASCSSPTAPTPAFVEFIVDVAGERFVVRTADEETTSLAEENRLGRNRRFPIGLLMPGNSGFNALWTWHLDPLSVEFVEMAIEVCDGRPSYVETHQAEYSSYGSAGFAMAFAKIQRASSACGFA